MLATHPNPPYNSPSFSNSILTMSNKTIAKNTLFLYIRMLFNMGAMLYMSRVVLQVLGVEDFGIYNIDVYKRQRLSCPNGFARLFRDLQ